MAELKRLCNDSKPVTSHRNRMNSEKILEVNKTNYYNNNQQEKVLTESKIIAVLISGKKAVSNILKNFS